MTISDRVVTWVQWGDSPATEVPRQVTGIPDTAHHGGLRTAARRVLWLAGLLLGLWLLSWILADDARADGLGIRIPVVQPVVDTVVPDVGKVPDLVGKVVQGPKKGPVKDVLEPVGKAVQGLENGPVKDLLEPVKKTVEALPVQLPDVGKVLEPVGKVVQGLEKGPVKDLLDPVKKIVDALPAPLPDVVTPILEPVGSVGDTVGGLTPDPGIVLPASPATPAPSTSEKAKPAHSAPTTTSAAPAESVATAESSLANAVHHDFRIPVAAEVTTPKTVLLNHSARQPTGHSPLSGWPGAPAEPSQVPAPTTLGATGSVAAVVVHDAAPGLTAPGRLVRPQGVFAPLWRALKPGTSPG